MPRILFTCLLVSVSGCAPGTAALIDEAMETGDWQAVNRQLDAETRRKNRRMPSCPAGRTALCVSDFGYVNCRCVGPAAFDYALGGLVR